MKISLDRKILIGFAASAIVLIVVAIVSYNNSEKVLASSKLVSHTHEVLYEFESVLASNVDAETGERGYIITGKEEYLQPFNDAKEKLSYHLKHVRELTADNPAQQKNIDSLDVLANRSLAFLQKCINTRRDKGMDSTIKLVATGESKRILDEARRIIADAEGIEKTLLEQRSATSEADTRSFNVVFLILLFIIAAVLVSIYFIIIANLKALRKAEASAADKNWSLSGNGELNKLIQGNKEEKEIAGLVINHLAPYINAQVGAFYLLDESSRQPNQKKETIN